VEVALETVAERMEGRPLALRVKLTGRSRLRGEMIARAQDFRDEIQGACHRCHQDIWLEKLDVRLEPLTAAAREGGGLGLEGLLPVETFSPELLAEASSRIGEIAARLPGGLGAGELVLGDDAESLLAEARDLLLSRAAQA
jgi:hypothetical protein